MEKQLFNPSPTFPQQVDPLPADPLPRLADLNVADLYRSAYMIGASVAGAGIMLSLPTLLVDAIRPFTPYALLASLVLGGLTGAVLSIRWISRAISHRIPQKPHDLLPPATTPYEYAMDRPHDAPAPAEKLRLAGFNLLVYHYQGHEATRPECERELKMTQTEWAAINKILLALGMKRNRSWLNIPATVAYRVWSQHVEIRDDNSAMVKPLQSNNWKRVDFKD